MLAVATPPPSLIRSVSAHGKVEGMRICWSDSNILNQEENSLNASIMSEFPYPTEYDQVEELFLRKEASTAVAAALLEPVKRRPSRLASFRSPKRHSVAPESRLATSTNQSRPRPVSAIFSRHKSMRSKKRDCSVLESGNLHPGKPHHQSSTSLYVVGAPKSDSKSSGGRFAAFSKRWKRHVMGKRKEMKHDESSNIAHAQNCAHDQKVRSLRKQKRSSLSFRLPKPIQTHKTEIKEDEQWKTKLESLLRLGCQPTLMSVLRHSELSKGFRDFLRKEFSEENLDFWTDVEEYRTCGDHHNIARMVYSTYIESNAPREINVTFRTKTTIRENLENPDEMTFDEAQREIYRLMESDSYMRFISAAR